MIKEKMIVDKIKCTDMSLTDECFIVYSVLRASLYNKENTYCRSVSYIGYELFGRAITKTEEYLISKGLKELIDKDVISVDVALTKTEFIVDVAEINSPLKFFFYITIKDVRKLMNIDTKVNKFSLLRYYMILISTFKHDKSDQSGKVGSMAQSYIKQLSGLSITTMNKYNDLLVDNKLLYIAKSGDHEEYYNDAGSHRLIKFRNVYTRYTDKHLADSYVHKDNSHQFVKKVSVATNESRKYVQMYNAMLKGKEYDINTVAKIYNAMRDWNENKQRQYQEQLANGLCPAKPEYKDLSIFEQYELD